MKDLLSLYMLPERWRQLGEREANGFDFTLIRRFKSVSGSDTSNEKSLLANTNVT